MFFKTEGGQQFISASASGPWIPRLPQEAINEARKRRQEKAKRRKEKTMKRQLRTLLNPKGGSWPLTY
jgi:hypothetical protein